MNKQESIKLSKTQAFYLWMISDPSKAPKGTMGKLFNHFGGINSEIYKAWVNNQTKPI